MSLPAGESAAALLPVVLPKLRSSKLLATTATEEKAIMPPAPPMRHGQRRLLRLPGFTSKDRCCGDSTYYCGTAT